jgi:hypothetical protein
MMKQTGIARGPRIFQPRKKTDHNYHYHYNAQNRFQDKGKKRVPWVDS